MQLKTQIREVIDEFSGFRVIGFPWTSTDVPLVIASWSQRQRFETFDEHQVKQFVRANRNRILNRTHLDGAVVCHPSGKTHKLIRQKPNFRYW